MSVPPLPYYAPDASTAGPWQELWPSDRPHCAWCSQPRMWEFERFLRCRGCGEWACSWGCLWAHKKECHGD